MKAAFACLTAPFILVAAGAPRVPGCAAALGTVGGERFCVETPGGVAIAASAERAADLASLARLGEQRFNRQFSLQPTRYALFEFDDPAHVGGWQRAFSLAH